MNGINDTDFNWTDLIGRIRRRNVIPVIGPGLYLVETGENETPPQLLYNYLAEKLADKYKYEIPVDCNHPFTRVTFQYLKNNPDDYFEVAEFLEQTLRGISLVPANPLWKLARIKAFDIFITTTYDDFLMDSVSSVRSIPTNVLYHSVGDKELSRMDKPLFDSLNQSAATLVYHFFGHAVKNMTPAYTEKDILESIIQFQQDMVGERNENKLFGKLENSSLLFIGCGYDDWLFRFFVRTVSNKAYDQSGNFRTRKFIGDNFDNKKDPFQDLPRFLKNYKSEVFYSDGNSDFVDLLFEKLEQKYPEEIIQPDEFPGTVFISFEGKDRAAAVRLTQNLRKDGVDVWLDEREFEPGDDVDKTIIDAINRCPAFIPLISENSRKILTENGKLKYHVREWERAYTNLKSRDKDVVIIPVVIDGSRWMYPSFENLFYIKVPDGDRLGDYEKLKEKLLKLQQHVRG